MRKYHRFHGLITSVTLFILLLDLFGRVASVSSTSKLEDKSNKGTTALITAQDSSVHNLPALQTQIMAICAAYPNDTVAISLVDISSNKQYDFCSSEVMRGASTTKLIVAIDYLHQVELGNASLAQTIDGLKAQVLLQNMVEENNVISSNDAWYSLLNYLSYSQVTRYGATVGLSSFNAYYNTLTAHDEALLLQKLYEGDLINNAHAHLLYSFMQQKNGNDLIGKALPNDAIDYYKYGYLYGYLHDAALVTYRGKTFAIVIYTNNASGTIDDYATREQLFSAIIKSVLNFEN